MNTWTRARTTPLALRMVWMIAAIFVLPDLAFAQASPFQTGADNLVTNFVAIATLSRSSQSWCLQLWR
jgi:hypothetical protein